MGPRRYRRGNFRREVHRKRNLMDASMGPRRYRRGNQKISRQLGMDADASMGPRRYRRGNCDRELRKDRHNRMLQWGRDVIVAEIENPPASEWPGAELQWGRDVIVAEIRRVATGAQRGASLASMGPRRYRRGNDHQRFEQPTSALLASMGPRRYRRGNIVEARHD